ncbi:MAG TPA: YeeE/YedE thiosulfate transporter family protein, partial [Geobacteraceae bacterium]
MDAFHLRIVLVMLIVGTAAGFAMHRADYCLTAMVRDVFLLRSTRLLRTLLLAVGAGAVSFEVLRRLGISAGALFAPAGLGHVAGGAIFGVGMVIAGGCVIGTLYRMGTGQMLSWAAFGGLVAGNWIYAEVHPSVVRFQAGTVLFGGSPTL